jgi:hypothetical protein
MATLPREPKMKHLVQKQQALLKRRERLASAFVKAAEEGKTKQMRRTFHEIRVTADFLKSLARIQEDDKSTTDTSTHQYVVSSLFLHQCFKDLTADRDEQFFFITGSEVDGHFVLDQKAEFQHQKRTAVGVVGNTGATHRLLIKLEQFGHRLLAHFHSHPGTGVSATSPSGIDEGFQKRLESAGYPTVAAIFSRDGFVRFFRLDRNVQIQIHGSGVEEIGNQIYRLRQIDPA